MPTDNKRPFFMFPVIGIMLIIAIVFFVVRKKFAADAVPLPVAATIGHFAPGVAIGVSLKEASSHLSDVRWVPRVGYVGTMKDAGGFVQARLYPDAETRKVEYVSISSMGMGKMMGDLAIVFRNSNPRTGCITSMFVDDPPQRLVQYWVTRSDKGGVALISDWDTRVKQKPGAVVWSIIAWAGQFQGTPQLHAGFEPRPCYDSTAVGDPKTDDATEAVEMLNVAFRDSVWDSGAPVRQTAEERSAPNATPMTADACADPGRQSPTQLQTTTLVDVDLPMDFKLTNGARAEADAERSGYALYEWRGDDNSTLTIAQASDVHSGWTGLIATECELNIDGRPVHVDIANASTYGADFVVHGYFTMEAGSAVGYVAQARSHQRQEELLHALRTVSIKPRWGSRRVE